MSDGKFFVVAGFLLLLISVVQASAGSWRLVTGSGLKAWIMWGNLIASRIKKTFRLLPTRSQLPSSVLSFTAKAARIARGFRAVLGADHGRETHEHRRAHAYLRQDLGPGILGCRLIADLAESFEPAVRAGAARMDDPFGNALAIELSNFSMN
jgi:hypothetical protein